MSLAPHSSCLFCLQAYGDSEYAHSNACNYPKLPGKKLLASWEIQALWNKSAMYASVSRATINGNPIHVARIVALYNLHRTLESNLTCDI